MLGSFRLSVNYTRKLSKLLEIVLQQVKFGEAWMIWQPFTVSTHSRCFNVFVEMN